MTIEQFIRQTRREIEMSQVRLAELSAISRQTLFKIENGDGYQASFAIIHRILIVLKTHGGAECNIYDLIPSPH